MKRFNVLDPSVEIYQTRVLEASAGTGKTFAIENLFVRYLLEAKEEGKEPLEIDQILIVTFTRASTKDLYQRIYENLEKVKQNLFDLKENSPPYIKRIVLEGKLAIQKAKRRIDSALLCFDLAQIYTIHSFCQSMLNAYLFEANTSFVGQKSDQAFDTLILKRYLHDYFRVKCNLFPSQLQVLLHKVKGYERLENTLIHYGQKSIPIVSKENFSKQRKEIEDFLLILKQKKGDKEGIFNDLEKLVKKHKTKNFGKDQVYFHFERLVDYLFSVREKDLEKLFFDLYVLSTFFSEENRNKRASKQSALFFEGLENQEFWCLLIEDLLSFVKSFFDDEKMLAFIASDFQKFLNEKIEEEANFGPDQLLKKMEEAVICSSAFRKRIQARYQAVLIDEFQDTDPIQWNIFYHLFSPNSWDGVMTIVGDPKQSIYAFRQADIYTYLKACKTLKCVESLNVNYRSTKELVDALNALFYKDSGSFCFFLPKKQQEIEYQLIASGRKGQKREFKDQRGAIHFFLAEGIEGKEKFLNFILKEIVSLSEKSLVPYQEIAVLIRDRYEGEKVASLLKKHEIPFTLNKSKSLLDSEVYLPFLFFLRSVFNPKDIQNLKTVLGGLFFQWDINALSNFEAKEEELEKVLSDFYFLRKKYDSQGAGAFFRAFLNLKEWKTNKTVANLLHEKELGDKLFFELEYLFEWVLSYCSSKLVSLESLINTLEEIYVSEDRKSERFLIPTKDENAVNIVTIHSSKGLEYGVVFALGLATSATNKEKLIPVLDEEKITLQPSSLSKDDYFMFLEEENAEKLRQLYVAMTRAKDRLYVPVFINKKNEKKKNSTPFSPINLFLTLYQHKEKTKDFASLCERSLSLNLEEVLSLLDELKTKASITYDLLSDDKEVFEIRERKESINKDKIKLKKIGKISDQAKMFSFSRLAKDFDKDIFLSCEEKEFLPPFDYQNENKNLHTLPAGPLTGNFIHLLLENLDFTILKSPCGKEKLISYIFSFTEKTPFEGWEEVFFHMMENLLKTPLKEGVYLESIDKHMCFKEIEFLYPLDRQVSFDGLLEKKGYLKGVVDLIFVHKGLYYIVDWKSNWLGPSQAFYTQENIQKAMQEHHYDLQAQIYKEGLKRYLKIVEKKPFKECFGGVFYYFVRGNRSFFLN